MMHFELWWIWSQSQEEVTKMMLHLQNPNKQNMQRSRLCVQFSTHHLEPVTVLPDHTVDNTFYQQIHLEKQNIPGELAHISQWHSEITLNEWV